MDFPLSPYDDHWTAFITQPLINMSNPDDLRSVFKDPSDIEIHQAQMYPQVVTVLSITQVYSTWAVPHHGTSYWASAYSHGTHCGFPAYIKWYHHHSHHSYQPTISSMLMTPETISFGRGHHGNWEGNALYQGRRTGSLDHLPNGLHRSRVLNPSQPRSCDRP